MNLRLEFRPLTGAADQKDNFGLNGFDIEEVSLGRIFVAPHV